jgi:ELWxxDGT repeat protein
MLSAVGGLVSDINQLDSTPTDLTAVNGKLFFVTQDSTQGTDSLWATDGTATGAVRLSSIGSSDYGPPASPPTFVSSNGAVYFLSTDSKGAPGLFKSDGTIAGTAEIASLSNPGSGLTAAGGKLFFTEHGSSGVELWSSDGTASGTA